MWRTLKYIFKYKQETVDRVMIYLSLVCSLLVLFQLGYNKNIEVAVIIDKMIVFMFYALAVISTFRVIVSMMVTKYIGVAHYGGIALMVYFILIIGARLTGADDSASAFLQRAQWVYVGIFAVLLMELSKRSLFFDTFYFNPTILFVISFLMLILLGTLLLMLPRAVEMPDSMSFVDAFFMATSAVCITGLSVVDVATDFTHFGQVVMLSLMQVGGLGIMTFTGFFGYFFSGGFSYKNQLMYSEILGHNKVGSVISALLKIIFITLFFEAVGVLLIYFSVEPAFFVSKDERIFFSIFHAVSAFCNAGFSTIPDGFQNPLYRFQYDVQLIIAGLFLLGGLGFGMVLNIYTFVKRWTINIVKKICFGRAFVHKAWVINFNSRLVAWTTLFLVIFATLLTFLLEYDNALQGHDSAFGKWVTAFFVGNTPRSAGFSTTNMNALSVPTILLLLWMMWIGCSPGSTGGGIKTTTFAVATLNILSLSRGKEHLEIFRRRISHEAVNKAFAIIALSLLAIGVTAFAITLTDSGLPLRAVVFESFSAYTTSGLSMGITALLSSPGKIILAFSMFVGRVGLLTLMVALIKNTKNKSYIYPEEKVLF